MSSSFRGKKFFRNWTFLTRRENFSRKARSEHKNNRRAYIIYIIIKRSYSVLTAIAGVAVTVQRAGSVGLGAGRVLVQKVVSGVRRRVIMVRRVVVVQLIVVMVMVHRLRN